MRGLPAGVRRAPHSPEGRDITKPAGRDIYLRARGAIVRTLHAADQLVSRLGRSEVRVLFEAATPMVLAVFRPVLTSSSAITASNSGSPPPTGSGASTIFSEPRALPNAWLNGEPRAG